MAAEIKAIVVSGYGFNADAELAEALRLAGARPERVHLSDLLAEPAKLDAASILAFPGGLLLRRPPGLGAARGPPLPPFPPGAARVLRRPRRPRHRDLQRLSVPDALWACFPIARVLGSARRASSPMLPAASWTPGRRCISSPTAARLGRAAYRIACSPCATAKGASS